MCLMSYTAHGLAMLQPCLALLASLVNSSTPSYPALLVACLTLLVCLLIQPCLASFVCLFILFGLTPLVCLLISLTYYYYNYGCEEFEIFFYNVSYSNLCDRLPDWYYDFVLTCTAYIILHNLTPVILLYIQWSCTPVLMCLLIHLLLPVKR